MQLDFTREKGLTKSIKLFIDLKGLGRLDKKLNILLNLYLNL